MHSKCNNKTNRVMTHQCTRFARDSGGPPTRDAAVVRPHGPVLHPLAEQECTQLARSCRCCNDSNEDTGSRGPHRSSALLTRARSPGRTMTRGEQMQRVGCALGGPARSHRGTQCMPSLCTWVPSRRTCTCYSHRGQCTSLLRQRCCRLLRCTPASGRAHPRTTLGQQDRTCRPRNCTRSIGRSPSGSHR